MNLDAEDISALRKSGVKVVVKGKAGALEPKSNGKSDTDYLKEISARLAMLVNKPDPTPAKLEAPNVTVQPPEVTVNTPKPEPRIKKWKFVIHRDGDGKAKEITATAVG